MGNRNPLNLRLKAKRNFLLFILFAASGLYGQKINCGQIHQLEEISTHYEKYIGRFLYTDDYVHFHHFESNIIPGFSFHSYFDVDSGLNSTGDTISLYVMFGCLLDSFINEPDGAPSYKRLKPVVKRCLGAKFRCHQYDENPLQLWCFADHKMMVFGMKYEPPYGNVLFIEYIAIFELPVKPPN